MRVPATSSARDEKLTRVISLTLVAELVADLRGRPASLLWPTHVVRGIRARCHCAC